jgi:hypothetical protein
VSSDQSELLHTLHGGMQGPALFRYVLQITGDYTFAEMSCRSRCCGRGETSGSCQAES